MTYRLQLCYPISCYSLCRRSTVCAIFLPRPLLLRPCRHVFRIEGKKSLPFWGALNLCRRRSKRLQQIHLLIKQCKMLSSQCIYVSSVSNRWCTATNSWHWAEPNVHIARSDHQTFALNKGLVRQCRFLQFKSQFGIFNSYTGNMFFFPYPIHFLPLVNVLAHKPCKPNRFKTKTYLLGNQSHCTQSCKTKIKLIDLNTSRANCSFQNCCHWPVMLSG